MKITKKLQEKFERQMESYREGIVEDLKSGRHISAIIEGYGFIYVDEFERAKEWIAKNIKIANGYICMTCGKTNSDGTNKDGECETCEKSLWVAMAEKDTKTIDELEIKSRNGEVIRLV